LTSFRTAALTPTIVAPGNCRDLALDDLVKRGALRNSPKDPWGTPLVLHCPSEHEKDPVDVISAGPDKKPDTEDDIRSWEL
jgi:hypothetical protein